MNTLILSLELPSSIKLELLLLSLFYSGLIGIAYLFLGRSRDVEAQSTDLQPFLLLIAVLFVLVTVDSVLFVAPAHLLGSSIQVIAGMSLVAMLGSAFLEIATGQVAATARWRPRSVRTTRSIGPESRAKEGKAAKALSIGVFVGLPILEEVLFRGILLTYFLVVGLPIGVSVAISAFSFGVNHYYGGPLIIIQKVAAGFVFGLAFYVAGLSLLVPVISHLGENSLIVLMGKARNPTQVT